MTQPSEILLRLAQHGLHLEVDGGDLLVRPRSRMTDDLLAELRARKAELLDALGRPGETAKDIWNQAVREIGERWDRAFADFAGQENPPCWIDDLQLQEAIGGAIKAGDFQRTLELAAKWYRAWLELLESQEARK